jgi:hypothetical protein
MRPWLVTALVVSGFGFAVVIVVQWAMRGIDRGVVAGWRDGS